jgi:K+-sensing histidine kinase KdpD
VVEQQQQPAFAPTTDAPYRTSPPPMPRQLLHPPRPWGVRYALSAAAWLVALALTLAFRDYVERASFVFFWVAVLFAAWWGGLVPALLAALAAGLLLRRPARVADPARNAG